MRVEITDLLSLQVRADQLEDAGDPTAQRYRQLYVELNAPDGRFVYPVVFTRSAHCPLPLPPAWPVWPHDGYGNGSSDMSGHNPAKHHGAGTMYGDGSDGGGGGGTACLLQLGVPAMLGYTNGDGGLFDTERYPDEE